jgi:glycosyltransferase involved in cell wall biosynthesis
MRVLHLTPEFPPVIWGGLGTAVGGLANASARAGMSVGVLLVGGPLVTGDHHYGGWQPFPFEKIPSDAVVNRDGVVFFHVSPDEAYERGLRLGSEWKPDVIHLHTAWLAPLAQMIRERTNAPMVLTVHSLDRAEYEVGEFVTQWTAQDAAIAEANRVIAISQSEQDLMEIYCPEVLSSVRIAGNGIDDSIDAGNSVRKRCWNKENPVVLFTGRFVQRKGIMELLAAIPQVLKIAPTTQFVLVGGYGGGAEIERDWMLETLLPYRDRVHFTGWLSPSDVAKWYGAADILVVPSWYEPFGMVVLEGMLYGLPIAATDVGGPAEILEHERTALLFPAKNVAALTDTLLRLITDSLLRRKLGKAASSEVRKKWLWSQMVKKFRRIYQETIETAKLN